MIPVYQYPNQQGLTTTSVQQHVPTQLAISIPQLVFPLNCYSSVVPTESSASHNGENICTRDRSNYMRLQRCTGILVYKWLCTVRSVSELGKGVERTKIQGCHFILQVKFYTRPTRYRKILLIADSEKNNK